MKTDAIVNAANVKLRKGGGVSGVIFEAAGVPELEAACESIGGCPVGEAVITPGYKLGAQFIIHTVRPIWQDGEKNEEELLHNAYLSSLELALESPSMKSEKRSLEDVLDEAENTFSEMLLRLIDEKGMTDVAAYKNANIDRRLFSKIRSNRNY